MHIRADMRSKRYFRSGYIVFRGILGQLRVLSRMTLLSTFSTQFSTFRVIPVFPRRFSAVIHGNDGNDRKCIKKCISVPKMSFYENNRAGNAVLSAFPGKILQKNGNKKRASLLGRLLPKSVQARFVFGKTNTSRDSLCVTLPSLRTKM